MKILFLEPFYAGSHRRWCEEIQEFSSHDVHILSLSGNHWKWRMHGAAVEFAENLNVKRIKYDLIIASDFLDLATFKSLFWDQRVPFALYFHENQITYPWSEKDQDVFLKRDNHYGWINFTSALVADCCFFNSNYHLRSFIQALPSFLAQFPDGNFKHSIDLISKKSKVLHLGMKLNRKLKVKNMKPVILWNHRWEYDKNPSLFFQALEAVQDLDWELIVLGNSYEREPSEFSKYHSVFKDRIIQWGYVSEINDYHDMLAIADILLTTSIQDFFGGSVVEAIYAGAFPILPNRLAYMEHVSDRYLYNNESELDDMLRLAIAEFSSWDSSTSKMVEKYNWVNCIAMYDEVFETCI
jgi:glycosyltransferase involved in cell wall biosynthesis